MTSTTMDETIEGRFAPGRIAAIKFTIELGRTLQQDVPEIAELYRQGDFLSTILERLDIQSRYGINRMIARTAVSYAIRGHDGSFKISPYEGLIPEEERERLAEEHNVEGGHRSCEGGKGIHGRTLDQMSEDSRKGYKSGLAKKTSKQRAEDGRRGGLVSGPRLYEEKRGIHAQTLEDKRIISRKANLAKGNTPWAVEEREYAHQLSQKAEYQWDKGHNRGKSNLQLIALELNVRFHGCKEVRKPNAIALTLGRYRKFLKGKSE